MPPHNLIVPFDWDIPFRTAFFDKADYFYFFNKENIYFGFHIPLYTKSQLVKIKSRPLILNEIPCVYKENIFYATSNHSDLMLYSDKSYHENCNWNRIDQKFFCKNPTKARKCDKLYIINRAPTFDEACFKVLPKRNMATRTNNDIYFTLFSPLQINIICESQEFNLLLNTSTKISDLNDCSVNTTFYRFNANLTFEHEFVVAPELSASPTKNKQVVIIYFLSYLTLLAVICIIANCTFSYHRRKALKNFYAPNPHVFVAEAGQLNVAIAGEAVIIHVSCV